MDCLDRTNVVQGVFSRIISHIQLSTLGLSQKPKGQPFEVFANREMEQAFRNIWTDNADALSLLYTGTPALKTDFTRTGKRSMQGAIDDGKHAMIRYYINNFCDGYNHDCLDLAQGQIKSDIRLKQRPMISSLQICFLALLASVYGTVLLMHSYFPVTDVVTDGPFYTQEWFKTMVLHKLVTFGVFLFGGLSIYSK